MFSSRTIQETQSSSSSRFIVRLSQLDQVRFKKNIKLILPVMKKNPKIILLGQSYVGKTSILQMLMHGTFQEKMPNTLGACFHSYDNEDENKEKITMDIWDTAGQEKYRSLLTLYYKNTDAVIIVFDFTNPDSLKTVDFWAKQIEENCERMPCIILAGNKQDLKQKQGGIKEEEINKFLAKKPKWKYFSCSAKTGYNIKNMFNTAHRMIREAEKLKSKLEEVEKSKLKVSNKRREERGNCC